MIMKVLFLLRFWNTRGGATPPPRMRSGRGAPLTAPPPWIRPWATRSPNYKSTESVQCISISLLKFFLRNKTTFRDFEFGGEHLKLRYREQGRNYCHIGIVGDVWLAFLLFRLPLGKKTGLLHTELISAPQWISSIHQILYISWINIINPEIYLFKKYFNKLEGFKESTEMNYILCMSCFNSWRFTKPWFHSQQTF